MFRPTPATNLRPSVLAGETVKSRHTRLTFAVQPEQNVERLARAHYLLVTLKITTTCVTRTLLQLEESSTGNGMLAAKGRRGFAAA